MNTYYHIVPINDGYHYLGIGCNGQHILFNKCDNDYNPTLVFKTYEEAYEYINKVLDKSKYKAEEIWLNERFYPGLIK